MEAFPSTLEQLYDFFVGNPQIVISFLVAMVVFMFFGRRASLSRRAPTADSDAAPPPIEMRTNSTGQLIWFLAKAVVVLVVFVGGLIQFGVFFGILPTTLAGG